MLPRSHTKPSSQGPLQSAVVAAVVLPNRPAGHSWQPVGAAVTPLPRWARAAAGGAGGALGPTRKPSRCSWYRSPHRRRSTAPRGKRRPQGWEIRTRDCTRSPRSSWHSSPHQQMRTYPGGTRPLEAPARTTPQGMRTPGYTAHRKRAMWCQGRPRTDPRSSWCMSRHRQGCTVPQGTRLVWTQWNRKGRSTQRCRRRCRTMSLRLRC